MDKIYSVYRNLTNKKISIKYKSRVVGYADEVVLVDATFVVNTTGRNRVLESKQKNVHAFVKGNIAHVENFVSRQNRSVDIISVPMIDCPTKSASYNPYKEPYFYDVDTNSPLYSSPLVKVTWDGKILYQALKG